MDDITGKRLTRSRRDKKIAGVCGGIGRYFGIDPTLVRIIFLVLLLVYGGGLMVYLVCWLLMGEE
ncbi:MAG: PspC domain-containing protein [Bacteroidales bacterium]|nr:PspC domain-containing protein [Bacteroidales bacterium]